MSTRNLTQSDLILPTQSLSLSSTLSSLKRSALSIPNRLNSIISDSEFIQTVAEAYQLPLVANERCGSWYIPLEKKVEGVYFKSTDGHMNEWSFNLRRLNYQLLDVVSKYDGCIIVDSTRRGKSMPDALSKTIPIWCCVLNRALFPENTAAHELHTSPQAVSASEHAQIEKRLDRFVREFMDICRPNVPSLKAKLTRPLRPLWVIQGNTIPETAPSFPDFHPIVLCTASRRVDGGEVSEGGYIQGAADDHEAWSHGLTPKLFWSNQEELMITNEEELPNVIEKLVKEETGPSAKPILIKPTNNLFVSSSENLDLGPFDIIISCTPEPLSTTKASDVNQKKYLHLVCQAGKLGSRDLRQQLQRLEPFVSALGDLRTRKIVICCPNGKDLSIGVALATICLYSNDDGEIGQTKATKADKNFIKQRLTWITTAATGMNPSRETLKSVNSYLMPDPHTSGSSETPSDQPVQSELTLVTPQTQSKPPQKTKIERIHIPVTDIPIDQIPSPLLRSRRPPSPPLSVPERLFTAFYNDGHAWTFSRRLVSKLPSHPSGTVTGTATFTPIPNVPTTAVLEDPVGAITDMLLYSEEGEFATENGMRFTARRKYVYVLKNGAELDEGKSLSVHFYDDASKDAEKVLGGLFVEMDEVGMGDEDGVVEARNRERHLCGEDLYSASWKFGGAILDDDEEEEEDVWWEVRYDVKGPKKDYFSETRYVRVQDNN